LASGSAAKQVDTETDTRLTHTAKCIILEFIRALLFIWDFPDGVSSCDRRGALTAIVSAHRIGYNHWEYPATVAGRDAIQKMSVEWSLPHGIQAKTIDLLLFALKGHLAGRGVD